jgi:hypothetical protein
MRWYAAHIAPPLLAVLAALVSLWQAYEQGRSTAWTIPLLLLAGALTLLFIGLRSARAQLLAMDALVASAIAVARRHYGVHATVAIRGELGGLAHAFNYMSDQLADAQHDLEDRAHAELSQALLLALAVAQHLAAGDNGATVAPGRIAAVVTAYMRRVRSDTPMNRSLERTLDELTADTASFDPVVVVALREVLAASEEKAS